MKLEPGKCDYPLVDCGPIERVTIAKDLGDGTGFARVLMEIDPEEWATIRGDPDLPVIRAAPVYFALLIGSESILVWPAPDKAYEIHVRYFPQMREV